MTKDPSSDIQPLEFKPFVALEEGASAEYPGLLFDRQFRDAHAVLKVALQRVNAGDERFQSIADLALGVMNAITAALQVPGVDLILGNPAAEKYDRRSAMACFLAGFEVAKLALATAQLHALNGTDDFDKAVRRHQTKRATEARSKASTLRAKAIQAVWASGNFASRDICAEQEYDDLGFGSIKTARTALLNTPDPVLWTAKKGK